MNNTFDGKNILITGAGGTIGTQLLSQLLSNPKYSPSMVVGIDNDETKLFFLDQEYLNDERVRFFVSDVCNRSEVERRVQDIDIIFHAAALKHVILCERSPDQAVMTNIVSLENIISAAKSNNVERVIFTSSDKAVNPTSVMGATKLMGERLITAANVFGSKDNTIFAATRFGNVLGSSGSVLPIFHNQIAKGEPLTITDEGMSRFVMSKEQAAELVLDSCFLAHGGEIFVTKMPVVNIIDLAQSMALELAPIYGNSPDEITNKIIGSKPGEKLYEELMSSEEIERVVELQKYFVVLPALRGALGDISYDFENVVREGIDRPYVSSNEDPMDVVSIRKFLNEHNLLMPPEESASFRYWPGDKEEKIR